MENAKRLTKIEDCYKEASEELLLLNIDKFGLDGIKEDHIFRVVKNSTFWVPNIWFLKHQFSV